MVPTEIQTAFTIRPTEGEVPALTDFFLKLDDRLGRVSSNFRRCAVHPSIRRVLHYAPVV